MKKLLKNKYIISVGIALFWLAVWEIAALRVNKAVLLPTPADTFTALFHLIKTKDFWISCLYSLGRVGTGFIAGTLLGTVIGFLCYKWRFLSRLLQPVQVMIKATPVASFIILALVWLGKNSIPSFTAFLMVTPIMWSGVYSSLSSIDGKLSEAAMIFPLTLLQKIRYIYIPSMKKKYIGSLETSLGLAWKAGIAAEVLCMPRKSMGQKLYDARVYIETDDLFAWTLCIIIISLVFEILMKKLFIRLFPEKGDENGNIT